MTDAELAALERQPLTQDEERELSAVLLELFAPGSFSDREKAIAACIAMHFRRSANAYKSEVEAAEATLRAQGEELTRLREENERLRDRVRLSHARSVLYGVSGACKCSVCEPEHHQPREEPTQ